jgi:Uma2 family endonuclease
VLSPSTESYDRGDKFVGYQQIETFAEYLLIAQDRPHVEQFVRQPDGQWLRSEVDGLDATIVLSSIPAELALSEIYDGVRFGAEGE